MNRYFADAFIDELIKTAARPRSRGSLVGRAAKGAARAVGSAGWEGGKAALPYMLIAGVPAALIGERLLKGFGEGVTEAERKRLSHER